jgi:kynurenine 3-monooxygenase
LHTIYLAKKGFQVDVFERRPDVRKAKIIAGRSINLALSDRGWKALEGAGITEEIKKVAIPMTGRLMHSVKGELTYQQYGKEDQAIYSVSRGGLNKKLLDIADDFKNVNFYFNHTCEDVDLNENIITFSDKESNTEIKLKFDRIFGTDGAFSAIRNRLQKTDRFNYSQSYLEEGYKELTIPANADGTHKIEKNVLHIWPRGKFMMIALPNQDGSFTCTLFFPLEGEVSFQSLDTKEKVKEFFEITFPDTIALIPTLVEDYFTNPTASLVTIQCSPWNYKDKILLMGDASHAIVPFYGQGMNSGFEDCTVLNNMFDQNHDWSEVFEKFSEARKPDTDAIAQLAFRNHIEMRDLSGDPKFLLRKKIEAKFSNKFPEKWLPLYSQVTFSHIPYHKANNEGLRQDKIMNAIMQIDGVEKLWDSELVENKMLELLDTIKE